MEIDAADKVEEVAEPVPPVQRAPRTSLRTWLREGGRTLFFCRPRWHALHATPAMMAVLVALTMLVSIAVGRLNFPGDATFNWRMLMVGAPGLLLVAWACYLLRRAPRDTPATAPDAAHLFTLLMAQSLYLAVILSAVFLALHGAGILTQPPVWAAWTLWLWGPVWGTLAELFAMMRAGDRKLLGRMLAIAALALSSGINHYIYAGASYWSETAATSSAEREDPLRFTQELIEDQGPLLEEQVDALKPQRPGIADMYTITFAPFEGEEVFRRESRMVSDVMAKRFDAAGRGLQMLNHREHLDNMAWATPLNLQRAIDGIAKTMDLEEDVLFIHLTSHGASDGELAADFWPLDVAPVTPPELRQWLDEAGIKHRVISISACFAGNWVGPLASDDTLVMTASDATHTSYGCGKKSPLTFFGRAMYDEQIRNTTLSFEDAHAAARKIIDQREKEAGKDDGYSNPQIKVGSRIRPYLEQMRARLQGSNAN